MSDSFDPIVEDTSCDAGDYVVNPIKRRRRDYDEEEITQSQGLDPHERKNPQLTPKMSYQQLEKQNWCLMLEVGELRQRLELSESKMSVFKRQVRNLNAKLRQMAMH
jgi:hypothetical protein